MPGTANGSPQPTKETPSGSGPRPYRLTQRSLAVLQDGIAFAVGTPIEVYVTREIGMWRWAVNLRFPERDGHIDGKQEVLERIRFCEYVIYQPAPKDLLRWAEAWQTFDAKVQAVVNWLREHTPNVIIETYEIRSAYQGKPFHGPPTPPLALPDAERRATLAGLTAYLRDALLIGPRVYAQMRRTYGLTDSA